MKKKIFLTILTLFLAVSVVSSLKVLPEDDSQINYFPEKESKINQNSGSDVIDKIKFVHYAKQSINLKKSTANCYKLMGIKWKGLPVSYTINPDNPFGLSEVFVTSAIANSAETWDQATSKELFNNLYTINSSAEYG